MVVGGGLEEDVCEVKETTNMGWIPSRSLAVNMTCRIPLSGSPGYDLPMVVLPIS